jgi:hypothetical protein
VGPFNKCPRCGLLDVRRTRCECGYDAGVAKPPPPAEAPTEAPRPSRLRKAVAVALVLPVAALAVVAIRWDSLGLGEYVDFLPGLVAQIIVGALGFALLALANFLWLGGRKAESS